MTNLVFSSVCQGWLSRRCVVIWFSLLRGKLVFRVCATSLVFCVPVISLVFSHLCDGLGFRVSVTSLVFEFPLRV